MKKAGIYDRSLGEKFFEIADHLGNVRVVVSDVKLPPAGGEFDANMVAYHNYYPFGMLQPGRSWTSDGTYRFLFNGMEKDDEVKGEGNSYDFGARILDPRLGRWLSVDPLFNKYPDYSPYAYAINSPLIIVDRDGREWQVIYGSDLDLSLLLGAIEAVFDDNVLAVVAEGFITLHRLNDEPMTASQEKLFAALNEVITDPNTIMTHELVNNDVTVFLGRFHPALDRGDQLAETLLGQLDVADINGIRSVPEYLRAFFGNEIHEQYLRVRDGADFDDAHDDGIKIEEDIIGMKRIDVYFNGTVLYRNGVLKSAHDEPEYITGSFDKIVDGCLVKIPIHK